MTIQKKNTGGRPSKLTERIISELERILEDEKNILFLTNQELFEELNEGLEKDERVSYTSFKDWKAGREQKDNPLFERFSSLIKKALRKQKQNLFENMMGNKEAHWQRYAWIIERKFSEWNMKKILTKDDKQEPLKVNIIKYSELSTEELRERIARCEQNSKKT